MAISTYLSRTILHVNRVSIKNADWLNGYTHTYILPMILSSVLKIHTD